MTTSIEQCLNASYHPDREMVGGVIVERNLGERTHSTIQGNLIGWFWDRRNQLPVKVYMQEKLDDYLRFGVPYVWIINPRLRKGYIATKAGIVEAASGGLATSDPEILVPAAELLDTD